MGRKWKLLILFFAFVFSACTTTAERRISGTDLSPATEGKLSVGPSEIRNTTELDLKVRHLAPLETISKNARTYVVWLKPATGEKQEIQNVGILRVDENLNGEFKTVIPHKNFDLFVTAEPAGIVASPTGERIFEVPVYERAE